LFVEKWQKVTIFSVFCEKVPFMCDYCTWHTLSVTVHTVSEAKRGDSFDVIERVQEFAQNQKNALKLHLQVQDLSAKHSPYPLKQ